MQHTLLRAALAALLALPAVPAFATVHGRHEPAHPPLHLDERYRHDHYYPNVGFGIGVLPTGSIGVAYAGGNWFFHGGVWFRPAGTRFIVAVPPPGIVVPALPPAYVTLWIGGMPYYYANGVYYAASPGGYAVVAPPTGAAVAQVVPVTGPAPANPIAYPRNGQGAAQLEADRAACNQWAGAQPGAAVDPGVFLRAFGACMDGRGYSVR